MSTEAPRMTPGSVDPTAVSAPAPAGESVIVDRTSDADPRTEVEVTAGVSPELGVPLRLGSIAKLSTEELEEFALRGMRGLGAGDATAGFSSAW